MLGFCSTDFLQNHQAELIWRKSLGKHDGSRDGNLRIHQTESSTIRARHQHWVGKPVASTERWLKRALGGRNGKRGQVLIYDVLLRRPCRSGRMAAAQQRKAVRAHEGTFLTHMGQDLELCYACI